MEPKDLRVAVNKALAYVRFPNMEQAEFALNVATKCLLDEKELISLMICFMVPQQNRYLFILHFVVKLSNCNTGLICLDQNCILGGLFPHQEVM